LLPGPLAPGRSCAARFPHRTGVTMRTRPLAVRRACCRLGVDAATDFPADVQLRTEVRFPAEVDASSTDAVADGGNPSLRFGDVYRRTMNDSSGGGCTTSSRCHGRPGEQFDLSSERAAYASLVGVMGSCGVRVTPCDLSASYLSSLMHRPDTCRGSRHTGFGQTMSLAQVALLDAWILGGAQR